MNESFSPQELEAQGRRLAEQRKALGLSQKGLAEAVGTSREVIGRYERGIYPTSMEVFAYIAKMGGDPQYILLGMKSDDPVQEMLTPDEVRLIDNYRNLPDNDKRHIKAYIEALSFKAVESGTGKTVFKRG